MHQTTRIASTILIILFLISQLPTAAQSNADIKKSVEDLTSQLGMRHATLGVSVYNISKKKVVYEYQAQQSLVIASVNKLFTTAAGFDRLGTTFRFKTTLAYNGTIDNNGTLHGNLYIIGGGDPMLGSYRYKQTKPDSLFANWARALSKHNIRAIDGRICYNNNIFDDEATHTTWAWCDIGNYYGAGAYGLNFHENMYFAYFNSGLKTGFSTTIDHITPAMLNIHGFNEVTTGNEKSVEDICAYGDPASNTRYYRGTLPLGKKDYALRVAMPKPSQVCAEMFANYLKKKHVSISNYTTESNQVPKKATTILTYYSNTYYVIAQLTNQTSNNVYAESIFKYLGYNDYDKGSFANGSKSIYEYFKKLGLPNHGAKVVDGSGLSRWDHASAHFVSQFLAKVYEQNYFEDFRSTLSKVGESGTARNILSSMRGRINMNVKSGSMTDVKSFAGYTVNAAGDLLCFCIISNNHDYTTKEMSSKLEKVLQAIAQCQ